MTAQKSLNMRNDSAQVPIQSYTEIRALRSAALRDPMLVDRAWERAFADARGVAG